MKKKKSVSFRLDHSESSGELFEKPHNSPPSKKMKKKGTGLQTAITNFYADAQGKSKCSTKLTTTTTNIHIYLIKNLIFL